MKLIVGLGNPTEKYRNTRHNIGFLILDHLLEDLLPVDKTFWQDDKTTKSLIKEIEFGKEKIVLAKPITFMNLSGEAINALIKKYNLKSQDLYVIHDDIDLPFGHIKVRFGGGSAGHKGVESIIDSIGTDSFLRIRVGIGQPEKVQSSSVEDYVLENFSSHETGEVKHVTKEAIKIIKLILEKGIEMYMSKYNKKSFGGTQDKRLAPSD